MEDISTTLLDSPKKVSLQNQLQDLRTALKTFERTFTEQNGRKPKQNDIKNDPSIAARYKQYHKVQDVLAGKLPYDKLNEAKAIGRSNGRTHSRQDSGIGSSPRKQPQIVHTTPKKRSHPYELDPYDVPASLSPKPLMMAIGPTPHRDGKVLGLFDLLQRSGSANISTATPSSSARKRKIDELYQDTPARRSPLKVIQTPSRRQGKKEADLLEFLGDTPQKRSCEAAAKYSKTPQSEGKKFHLSQFFATPSTQRFLFADDDDGTTTKTPLRDLIMGQTPQKRPETTGLDATPTYLRRSTSFKDRLLSASRSASAVGSARTSPPAKRVGPPTLRHFRSSTNNILQLSDIQKQRPQPRPETTADHSDGYNDDLEALRELEDTQQESRVLVEDSQLNLDFPSELEGDDEEVKQPLKPYKKKGQKRTTKKASIRPVSQIKSTTQPKFVAADGSDSDEFNAPEGGTVIEETKLLSGDEHEDESDFSNVDNDETGRKVKEKAAVSKAATKIAGKPKKRAGMINPNAQSHTNFRSLKIKNKNSKGNGAGRAKFGRGRR